MGHRNNTRSLGDQRGDPGQQLRSRPGKQPGWLEKEGGGLSEGAGVLGNWEIILSFGDVQSYTERLLEGVGAVRDSSKAKQAEVTINHKNNNTIQQRRHILRTF